MVDINCRISNTRIPYSWLLACRYKSRGQDWNTHPNRNGAKRLWIFTSIRSITSHAVTYYTDALSYYDLRAFDACLQTYARSANDRVLTQCIPGFWLARSSNTPIRAANATRCTSNSRATSVSVSLIVVFRQRRRGCHRRIFRCCWRKSGSDNCKKKALVRRQDRE